MTRLENLNMESLGKNNGYISAQIAGLIGMIRPDHTAFPLLAQLAPNARFTVVAQNTYNDKAAILIRTVANDAVDQLVANGQLVFKEGQVSTDSDDHTSFLVQVSDASGTVLVAQRFDADVGAEEDTYGALYAGDANARVAIAERFLALLDRVKAADIAANQALVAKAEAAF